MDAFNQLYDCREQLMDDYAFLIEMLTDTAELEKEAAALRSECDITMGLIRKSVEENTRTVSDQDEYNRRYDSLVERYETASKRASELTGDMQYRAAKRESLTRFMDELTRHGGPLAEFDEGLWCETVEAVTVYSEKDVAFSFRDGSIIHVDARLKK